MAGYHDGLFCFPCGAAANAAVSGLQQIQYSILIEEEVEISDPASQPPETLNGAFEASKLSLRHTERAARSTINIQMLPLTVLRTRAALWKEEHAQPAMNPLRNDSSRHICPERRMHTP